VSTEMEVASTATMLRHKLEKLGIDEAAEATLTARLDGEYDCCILFPNRLDIARAVAFRNEEVAVEDAHDILVELGFVLHPKMVSKGKHITPYTRP
jgi:hypothetical protein